MSRTPKVALLIETSRGYGRALLRGVVRYARLHGPWGFYVTPGDFAQVLPRMQSWGGTGIIARIETPGVARAVLDSGLPAIALDLAEEQLRPDHPLARFSEIASDSHGAARMAAEHLLERGFRHYAFVGTTGRVWSDRRLESFCARIREAGFQPHVYDPPRARRDRVWEREQLVLARWLAELPRPIGLMSCDDDRGREVLEACRAGGLHVPEEVAVIGVDNDELLCELADPPLSSVALNVEPGGYRLAGLLDRLMRAPRSRPRSTSETAPAARRTLARRDPTVDRHCRPGRPGGRRRAPFPARSRRRADRRRRSGQAPHDLASRPGDPVPQADRPNDPRGAPARSSRPCEAALAGNGSPHPQGCRGIGLRQSELPRASFPPATRRHPGEVPTTGTNSQRLVTISNSLKLASRIHRGYSPRARHSGLRSELASVRARRTPAAS